MDENILDGLFFLTKGIHKSLEWQGRVLGKVEKGLYAVQLHEWAFGTESCVKLVPLEHMLDWDFYHSVDDWHKAAKKETNE
jgi:hypothetical protein